jgi:hypothetical protein
MSQGHGKKKLRSSIRSGVSGKFCGRSQGLLHHTSTISTFRSAVPLKDGPDVELL